eukprot:scaffold38295_cov56-Attheya_sp.AAC.1
MKPPIDVKKALDCKQHMAQITNEWRMPLSSKRSKTIYHEMISPKMSPSPKRNAAESREKEKEAQPPMKNN